MVDKESLVQELQSGDYRAALEEMRARGFLKDGSLQGINLKGADLRDADLSDANLLGANLSEADLQGADLRRAYLRYADLRRTNLQGANLSNAIFDLADLSYANLHNANLMRAFLGNARLNHAILTDANFIRAYLPETDFENAVCGGTTFSMTELTLARGLENIQHLGRSEIGIQTLYWTERQLPERFLRGCGIPIELLTGVRQIDRRLMKYHAVFIIHTLDAEEVAEAIYQAYYQAGLRCWLDLDARLAAHPTRIHGIGRYDKYLLLLNKQAMNAIWLQQLLQTVHDIEHEIFIDKGTKTEKLWILDMDESLGKTMLPQNIQKFLGSRAVNTPPSWAKNPSLIGTVVENTLLSLRL
jgi:hypothetical protein